MSERAERSWNPEERTGTVATPASPVGSISTEAFYYDVAMMRLNAQVDEIRSIDARASNLFPSGARCCRSRRVSWPRSETSFDCPVAVFALVAGAVVSVALVVLFVLAYRLANWDYRPELEQWRAITLGRDEDEMKSWLGEASVEAYGANVPQLERRARLTGHALLCLALESLALTVAVLAALPLR